MEVENKNKKDIILNRDSLLIELMLMIEYKVSDWLDEIENLNQCAYTDRQLEDIIEITNELKTIYNS